MRKLIFTFITCMALNINAQEYMNISSLVFFDATYDDSVSFNVTRTYVDFRKSISDDAAARVTIDSYRPGENDPLTFIVKHAYLVWNTAIGSFLIGQQPTNYFGPATANWGMRFIEKSPTDFWGFDSAADIGVAYRKNLSDNLLIHLAAYNGGGFKKDEVDTHKRLSALVSLGEQRLNSNPGWNAGGVVSFEPYDSTETKLRLSGFAGYATESLRLGSEFLKSEDSGGNNGQLLSIYGNFALGKALDVLARVDTFDEDIDTEDNRETYLIGGMHYQTTTGFSIAPTIRYTLFEDDTDPEMTLKLNFQFQF